MKKSVLCIALAPFLAVVVKAQSIAPSVVNSAGGTAIINGNTYEYAIGQTTAGTTLSSATLVVTQGVLQPSDRGLSVGQQPGVITGLQIFPSPVSDVLYLQPAMGKSGTLRYMLYDAGGKLVMSSSATLYTGNERQEADVHSIAAGQYTLQVQWGEGGGMSTGAYKIQKLK